MTAGTTQPGSSQGPLLHRCTGEQGGDLVSALTRASSISQADGLESSRALQRCFTAAPSRTRVDVSSPVRTRSPAATSLPGPGVRCGPTESSRLRWGDHRTGRGVRGGCLSRRDRPSAQGADLPALPASAGRDPQARTAGEDPAAFHPHPPRSSGHERGEDRPRAHLRGAVSPGELRLPAGPLSA
jgi:hypothetical protein